MQIKINSNVKIYFITSWIIGLVLLISMDIGKSGFLFAILGFITLVNVFINALVIIFLVVLQFIFSENGIEFLHSLLFIFFNFPFIICYYLLLYLI